MRPNDQLWLSAQHVQKAALGMWVWLGMHSCSHRRNLTNTPPPQKGSSQTTNTQWDE